MRARPRSRPSCVLPRPCSSPGCGQLLLKVLRPAPTEGPAAILTELFCWLWVFVWFEVLPWTGVPWDSLRTAAASNSKVRLVAAALGISFAALGASLDDCRWIEVSSLAHMRAMLADQDASATQPAVIPIVALARRRSWRVILVQSAVATLSVICLAPPFPYYNTVTIFIAAGGASICFIALVVLYSSLVALFEYRDLLGVGGNNHVETRPVRFLFAVASPLLGLMYWSWITRDPSPHTIEDSVRAGTLKASQWILVFQAVSRATWLSHDFLA